MADASASANERCLEGFLAHLRHERGLSQNTAENYARDVRKLFSLAGDTPLADIHPHQARRFVADTARARIGGQNIGAHAVRVAQLLPLPGARPRLAHNPFQGLRSPKAPKTLPKALSPDEAARLVDLPGDEPMTIRDRAMFELFYSSGLRLSELTGVKLGDVDFQDGTVRVTGKGNKTRVVPVGELRSARAPGLACGARRTGSTRSSRRCSSTPEGCASARALCSGGSRPGRCAKA